MPMSSREDRTEDFARPASVSDVAPASLTTRIAPASLRPRILLLEKDPVALCNYSSLLRNFNYHVTAARNQSDLFDLRETTGISLAIISDPSGAAALSPAASYKASVAVGANTHIGKA